MRNFFIFTIMTILLLAAHTVKAEETLDFAMESTGSLKKLPDGSTFQPYLVNDTRWYELFKFDSIVGRHCQSKDNCVLLQPNGKELNIDWTQVAAVGVLIYIRVKKPKGLPKWLTGRGSGGGSSNNSAAAVVGGGGAPPPPGGGI